VLYKVAVKATVKSKSGSLVKSAALSFTVPNTSSVKLVSSSSKTNSSGVAYAYYEVRGTTSFTNKVSMTVTGSCVLYLMIKK